MFSLDKFYKHNFHDGFITEYQNCDGYSILRGEFPEDETEESGCKYFYFLFNSAEPNLPYMGEDAGILSFDICEKKNVEDGYSVTIHAQNYPGISFISAEFECRNIIFETQKYKGMSYRNVYGTAEYDKYVESLKYVLNEKYIVEKKQYDLPESFTLEIESYEDISDMGTRLVYNARLQKCIISRNGQTVYEYLCTTCHHKPFYEFIYHKNGHRYYPFHIDLYGISYIDVDTLEVYNYIPEGYQHNSEYLLGESFIITDIHYDRESDLIAYGGCYWAGTNNVMVGDFSCLSGCGYPLEDMQDLIDPHYDKYDELDIESWDGEKLWLKCMKISVSIGIDEIKKLLKQK